LKVNVVRGVATLSIEMLRALRPGDAVLLDLPPVADHEALIRVGGIQCRAQWNSKGQARMSRPIGKESGVTDQASHEISPDPATVEAMLGGVEVEVVFVVSRQTMALSTLKRWMCGEVIDLQQPADRAGVDIAVNDVVVGRGEMVQLDGRLAVEITRLHGATR
jgi:type III secretion protein Q